MAKTKEYEPDEVAMFFPLMEGASYEQMKANVAERGFTDPATASKGKLLDGRNRQRIAIELGIELAVVEYEGEQTALAKFQFVVAKNLHRRHLNESQRAILAARAKPLIERLTAENKERKREGNRKGGKLEEALPPSKRDESTNTRAILGEAFTVSGRLVSDAATIDAEDPAIGDAILAGEKTVTEAKRERQAAQKESNKTTERKRQAAIVVSKPPPEVLKEEIKYNVVLVDEGWYHGPNDASWLEISNSPMPDYLADDAIVFIRTGGDKKSIGYAEAIIAKWELTLIDDQLLLKGAVDKQGKWFKRTVEEIVIGVQGTPQWPTPLPDGLVQCAPGRVHALIESLTPAYENLRLEIGTKRVKGWVCWPTGKEPVAA